MRVSVGPVVARRLLRYELERMCAKAGVTHAEMGERLGVSRASFTQLLAGKNLPSRPALEVMAQHLDAAQRLPRLVELLAVARPRTAEREAGAGVHDHELALGLEAFAAEIEVFDPAAVTPLLQTRAYARELVGTEEEVNARLRRQGTLTAEEPAVFHFLTDEHALRRRVGGVETMAEQCDHLLSMVARPNVTVRVIPADGPPPLVRAFQLFRADDLVVAHEETRRSAYYYDDPEAVADYEGVLADLRARALDPEQSRELIAELGVRGDRPWL